MRKLLLFLLFILSSLSAFANDVVIYEVPYRNLFEDGEWRDRNEYRVVDANNDNETWWLKDYNRIKQFCAKYTADDWVFLPGIRLEAGVPYLFSLMVRICESAYPGKIEVLVGKEPCVDAMNQVIKNPFKVSVVGGLQLCENRCFTVEESGVYYFGVHNISQIRSSVEIYEICVEKGILPESPDAVLDPVLIPDPVGHKKATIGFYGPIRDMANHWLAEDVVMDYEIDGQWVASGHPDEYIELVMEVPYSGDHEFCIVPFLNGNPGPKLRIEDYIGVDWPCRPKNITVEVLPNGLSFSWESGGNVGMYGHPVIEEDVTYSVVGWGNGHYGYIGTEENWQQKETSFTYIFPEDQLWFWQGEFTFVVVAYNEVGPARSNEEVKVTINPSDLPAITYTPDTPCDFFDLSGRKSSDLHPGLNIIRTEQGTKKVMIP